MKERLGPDSGSTEIPVVTTEVLLHQQSKALSNDNSLSSGGDALLDNQTAASSPATLPFRLQSSASSSSSHQRQDGASCSSLGASRASTLSLKKKVNIAVKNKRMQKREDIDSDLDLEAAHETTALNHLSLGDISDRGATPADNYLTMSGTITRGKRAGQQTDVKVNISREELELIESTHAKLKAELDQSTGTEAIAGQSKKSCCGLKKGLHIWLWSFICSPFVFLMASIYSFYMGTLTWYNVFSWYTEEKPFLCRVLMAPILIVSYPLLILAATVGLGIYTACSQLTTNWFVWLTQVQDLEKGFYAKLCSILSLDECSPYTEIVIVSQLDRIAPVSRD